MPVTTGIERELRGPKGFHASKESIYHKMNDMNTLRSILNKKILQDG